MGRLTKRGGLLMIQDNGATAIRLSSLAALSVGVYPKEWSLNIWIEGDSDPCTYSYETESDARADFDLIVAWMDGE